MIDKVHNHGSDNASELSQGLRDAVEQVLRDDAPQAQMEQALGRATAARPAHRGPQRRLSVYQAISLSVAASLLVAFLVSLWSPRSSNAWEEVVKTVKAKPWLHLKMTKSTAGAEGEIWASMEKRILAEKLARYAQLSDIGNGMGFRYEKHDGKIRQRLLSKDDKQRFALFELMCEVTIDKKDVSFAETGFRITGQTIRAVTIRERTWTVYDFTFEREYERGVTTEQLSFFVDPDKQLPLRMKYQSGQGNDRGGEATYSVESVIDIDYPEQGPESIYDLGAPRTAEVIPIDSADNE